jgi:hypothetical protein
VLRLITRGSDVHRSRAVQTLAILTLVVALADGLAAKGPTTRIVISAPGLQRPIETTDPKALANVWAGRFIAEASPEPGLALPRYLLTFIVQPPRDTPRAMYVATYVRDPQSGSAFVYLPGRGEDGWAMNVRTILRDGQDGRWHRASAEWSDAVAAAIHLR